MEVMIDRQQMIRAFSSLVFSTFNTASSSMRFEIINSKMAALYTCAGTFANRANIPIELIPDIIPEDTAFTVMADGILSFIQTIPSDFICLRASDKKLRIRGEWGNGNFLDQTYATSEVKVPKADELLGDHKVLGTCNSSILSEALRYAKGLSTKDDVDHCRIGVKDGMMLYVDETKVGAFKAPDVLPNMNITTKEIGSINTFLGNYKNEIIKVMRIGGDKGYAFQAPDGSVIMYGLKESDSGFNLGKGFDLNMECPITFEIELKSLLGTFAMLKTNASQLYDEMNIGVNTSGHLTITKEPSFNSRFTITPKTLDSDVDLTLQFSNLANVLRAFPKCDIAVIGIDPEHKKLRVETSVKILVGGGDDKATAECRIINVLSYWNK